MHVILSTPELSKRNFCDSLEIKFISPLGEIQQAGVSEKAEKVLLVVLL